MTKRALFVSGLPAVLLAATLAVPPLANPAPAAYARQAPTDGPGDDLDCGDFDGAGGFRAAQDNLLATWPDDPNRLDANANGIACENYDAFASDAAAADPAWVTLGQPAPGEAAAAAPPPASTAIPAAPVAPTVPPAPAPPAAAEVPQPPPVSYRQAVPADLLARIDDCAVVSVSRRRLVATGCRDGRSIFWKQASGEPNLKRTAVIRFINPLDRLRAPAAEPQPTPKP